MIDKNIEGAALALGKGEVVSSILTGSTTKTYVKFSITRITPNRLRVVSVRTKHEQNISSGGKSVESVPQAFTADNALAQSK